MKRILPWLGLILGAAFIGLTLLPHPNPGSFDINGFGRLPVLANGRVKPMDTLARTSLLQMSGVQTVFADDASTVLGEDNTEPLSPSGWLLDMFYRPDVADGYRVLTIDDSDLLSLIGRNEQNLAISYDRPLSQYTAWFSHGHSRLGGFAYRKLAPALPAIERTMAQLGFLPSHYRRFSYREVAPYLPAIESQAKLADPIDTQLRTRFQRAVLQLHENLALYQALRHALQPPDSPDFLAELFRFQDAIPAGVDAVRAKEAGKPHNEDLAQAMLEMGKRYLALSDATNILTIPPEPGAADPNTWSTAGQGVLEAFGNGSVNASVLAYAGMGSAWRAQNAGQFNTVTSLYRRDMAVRLNSQLRKCAAEARFNAAAPFSSSMFLYVLAFLLGIFSWLRWPEGLGRAAFQLLTLAWLLATAGIILRMWMGGRPPVTNLYSSALFVGWGSAGLCLILERVYRNAIGTVAGSLIGFATLVIAHYLALGGDTLEMMRAVLDSNFWLSTHVVVVTSGYASTLLAGFLAIIYVLRGVFTRSLDRATADSLARMVYGIVCFATLFSFVGTVLGGIWADQSWGRFWGWDPKENGALIIVLWNALILHARWGGMIRQRGLMCLALFGNIVTSWSWFGVNMLGVGLHSYGFTEAAFQMLTLFVAIQLALIAVANLPLAKWRSAAALKA